MKLPRRVPWVHRQEWLQARTWFYSNSMEDQKKAINRVRIWSERGKVPYGVECTENFVYLLHQFEKPDFSPHQLRLAIAMSMVRFVNGMIDPEQKTVFAMAVASLAHRLGLPPIFVDFRHQATHQDLPSLPVLKQALYKALDWLENTYWDVQKDTADSISEQIIESLKNYFPNFRNKKVSRMNLKTINDLLSPSILRGALISILLEPGYLIPENKNDRPTLENLTFQKKFSDMWMPALESFQNSFPSFCQLLLVTIIEKVQEYEAQGQTTTDFESFLQGGEPQTKDSKSSVHSQLVTLVAWASFLLQWNIQQNNELIDLSTSELMSLLLKKPTKYKILILKELSRLTTDVELKPIIDQSIRIATNFLNTSKPPKDIKGLTKQTISEKEIEEHINTMGPRLNQLLSKEKDGTDPELNEDAEERGIEKEKERTTLGWAKCSLSEWKACAIGSLTSTDYPTLDLPLSQTKRTLQFEDSTDSNKKARLEPMREDISIIKDKIKLF